MKTALFEAHQKAGGKIIDFGGWELPVQYSGTVDEHRACRSAAGLFDVSHMGEFEITGPRSGGFLHYLLTNDIEGLLPGQARYTQMCREDGGILDDLVVYRMSEDHFSTVVNAANIEKDFEHFMKTFDTFFKGNSGENKIRNASHEFSLLALQGRNSQKILQKLTQTNLAQIEPFHFKGEDHATFGRTYYARTGYTGEDGFEIFVPWDQGPALWDALMEAGTPEGLKPCGLGARDTLRLEMKYPLYGNDLTESTNPLEAGVGWTVKLKKQDFVGRAAIAAIKERGISRKLVGVQPLERGIPRHGYPILKGGDRIGEITSGTHSPSLGHPIALGYVEKAHSAIDSEFEIEIRGKPIPAKVVKTPFYKRPY